MSDFINVPEVFGSDVFLIPSMAIIAVCLTIMRKTGKEGDCD